jgi:pimeloyl-ACP methyl ester carboxylesterase
VTDPQEWYASGFFITSGKLRCFVKTLGDGPPVLCLHAFPTSSYDFSQVAPLLSDAFQLVFLDYPGFGYSSKPQNFAYSLLKYADAVQQVARHFHLERVYLLAHDIGDSIALELLQRGTPVIEKLVLMNGSVLSIPFTDPLMGLSQKLWLNPLTGPLISRLRLFRKALFAQMFARTFARPLSTGEIEAFWSLVSKNDGLGIYHRLMGYMPERWQYQQVWLDVLTAHPAPLTLIWGQADPVATPAVAEHVLSLRPDARYVKFPGIGHYPHWDAPQQAAQIVREAFST